MSYCPICNAPTHSIEKRIDGNSTCKNGHTYPTANALLQINAEEFPAVADEKYMTD